MVGSHIDRQQPVTADSADFTNRGFTQPLAGGHSVTPAPNPYSVAIFTEKTGSSDDSFGAVDILPVSVDRTSLIAMKPSTVRSERDKVCKRIFVVVPFVVRHLVLLQGTLATGRVSACVGYDRLLVIEVPNSAGLPPVP